MEKLTGKLALLLAQLPLAGGLAVFWHQAQQRPLVAVTVGVLYELGVIALAFGKKVWEELEKDAVKASADWVRAGVRNLFSFGFRRRYNKHLCVTYDYFNVRGLGLIDSHTLKLDEVFVDLKISPSANPQKLNPDPIAAKVLAEARTVWDFVRLTKKDSDAPTALAITGPPGCGKTTLMQHIAITLGRNRQRRYKLRAYTPILLFLREHNSTVLSNPQITLGDLADIYFKQRWPKLKSPQGWFERKLENGKCLVLLDGLDEVADTEQRKKISEWVDQQLVNYPKTHFIVTSRPKGYQAAPLERAHVVETLPFSAQQVNRFVKNWYLANETVSNGNRVDDGVRQRSEDGSRDLLQRLGKTHGLQALTANPLLLTMIAMVHRYRNALPGSRAELYDEICEVLLGRWRQSKGVQDAMTAAQKRGALMPLAAEMMRREIREISTKEAMEIALPRLERVGLSEDGKQNFLSDLQSGSGLVLERETQRWGFAHLTFQEYLTAAHWLAEKHSPDWKMMVGDSWWYETLRLYAATGDATPILQACLDADDSPSLTLAAEILEEGAREVLPTVRNAVEERVFKSLESHDSKLRRIAAEVLLSRRLKQLHRIDENREIDTTFITCAEYQLFLDDLRQEGKYHQPDHWNEYTFPAGQALKPVRGVRFEDADAFCKWLVKRVGGNTLYRLPSTTEASEWKTETTEIASWTLKNLKPELIGFASADMTELSLHFLHLKNRCVPLARRLENFLSAEMRSLDFSNTLGRDLDPKLAQALNIASDLDLALDRALALTLALVLEFTLTLTLNRSRIFNRASTLARDLNSALMNDLTRALQIAHTRDLEHTYNLDLNLDLTRDLYLARARALNLNIDYDLDYNLEAIRQIRDQQEENIQSETGYFNILRRIIINLLNIALTQTPVEMRIAQRKYRLHLLESAYRGYEMLSKKSAPFWKRLLRLNRSKYVNEQESVMLAWWWQRIVLAREEGELPAWEGIRIVREQMTSTEDRKAEEYRKIDEKLIPEF